MLSKDVELYPYRVFTKGGHVHQCWVPFKHAYDFWDMKCDLESKENSTIEGCYFAANGEIVMLFIDAKDVSGMDTPFDQSDPKTIQVHAESVQAIRTKHLKNKQMKAHESFPSVGQTVNKRRG